MRKVVKFGGSSLASAEQFKKVGSIIQADKDRQLVVPSAPGKRDSKDTKVTDMLYGCYALAEEGKDFSFATAILIGGHHVAVCVLLKDLNHVPYDFRPLLEIRVNQADIFPVTLLQSGVDGGFLSKIPGEGHHFHRAILSAEQLFEIVQGGIFTSVVDKDDFIVVSTA